MTEQPTAAAQACFIDMPFGKKVDAKSGVEIDFDQVYEAGIKPAVEASGLQCIRGDMEKTGGIIHEAMFARLLLSEFVVADMTTANANVFYELGVRHAARPYTTIPIFATLGGPPFDVNMVRAIPYELTDGRLGEEAAGGLQEAVRDRIKNALEGPVADDSPLFQLFENFPTIELSHELTDVFQDTVTSADWPGGMTDCDSSLIVHLQLVFFFSIFRSAVPWFWITKRCSPSPYGNMVPKS